MMRMETATENPNYALKGSAKNVNCEMETAVVFFFASNQKSENYVATLWTEHSMYILYGEGREVYLREQCKDQHNMKKRKNERKRTETECGFACSLHPFPSSFCLGNVDTHFFVYSAFLCWVWCGFSVCIFTGAGRLMVVCGVFWIIYFFIFSFIHCTDTWWPAWGGRFSLFLNGEL